MSNINKYLHKATVSNVNTSVTVYGEAAKTIETIVVATVLVIAIVLIARVLS